MRKIIRAKEYNLIAHFQHELDIHKGGTGTGVLVVVGDVVVNEQYAGLLARSVARLEYALCIGEMESLQLLLPLRQ